MTPRPPIVRRARPQPSCTPAAWARPSARCRSAAARKDGQGQRRHQRHEHEQHVGGQVGENHRVDQPEAGRDAAASNAEMPARTLAAKKMCRACRGRREATLNQKATRLCTIKPPPKASSANSALSLRTMPDCGDRGELGGDPGFRPCGPRRGERPGRPTEAAPEQV